MKINFKQEQLFRRQTSKNRRKNCVLFKTFRMNNVMSSGKKQNKTKTKKQNKKKKQQQQTNNKNRRKTSENSFGTNN